MRFPFLHRIQRTRQPALNHSSPRNPTTHRDLWARALRVTHALRLAYTDIHDIVFPWSSADAHTLWLHDSYHAIIDAEELLHLPMTSRASSWWATTNTWYSRLYNKAMVRFVSKAELSALIAEMERLAAEGHALLIRGAREAGVGCGYCGQANCGHWVMEMLVDG